MKVFQEPLKFIERVLTDRIVVSDTTADNTLFPGFFQGVSGIGYELLRLNAPESLPNILLFK
jgi:lantibiotic modifying enzyme